MYSCISIMQDARENKLEDAKRRRPEPCACHLSLLSSQVFAMFYRIISPSVLSNSNNNILCLCVCVEKSNTWWRTTVTELDFSFIVSSRRLPRNKWCYSRYSYWVHFIHACVWFCTIFVLLVLAILLELFPLKVNRNPKNPHLNVCYTCLY